MAFTPKPGTGSLFKNDMATEENKQPNYRGNCALEDGTLLEIGGWIRKSASGSSFMSLKFQPPRNAPPASKPPVRQSIPDEDIPF